MQATYPACRYHGEVFVPGETWKRSNFCRAAYLTEVIRETPGLSAWELSNHAGMLYSDVVRGLNKAREWGLVEYDVEERTQGGKRFRYRVAPDAEIIMTRWQETGAL